MVTKIIHCIVLLKVKEAVKQTTQIFWRKKAIDQSFLSFDSFCEKIGDSTLHHSVARIAYHIYYIAFRIARVIIETHSPSSGLTFNFYNI